MKSLFVLAVIVCLCGGCATTALGPNATSAEKKAALCADAKAGLQTADAALAVAPVGSQEKAYWEAFKAGALVASTAYCQ